MHFKAINEDYSAKIINDNNKWQNCNNEVPKMPQLKIFNRNVCAFCAKLRN